MATNVTERRHDPQLMRQESRLPPIDPQVLKVQGAAAVLNEARGGGSSSLTERQVTKTKSPDSPNKSRTVARPHAEAPLSTDRLEFYARIATETLVNSFESRIAKRAERRKAANAQEQKGIPKPDLRGFGQGTDDVFGFPGQEYRQPLARSSSDEPLRRSPRRNADKPTGLQMSPEKLTDSPGTRAAKRINQLAIDSPKASGGVSLDGFSELMAVKRPPVRNLALQMDRDESADRKQRMSLALKRRIEALATAQLTDVPASTENPLQINKFKVLPKIAAGKSTKLRMFEFFSNAKSQIFYHFAKDIIREEAKKEKRKPTFLTRDEFERDIYYPMLDLLKEVETTQNLDFLLHKEAAIGRNSTEEQKMSFAKIESLIEVLMANLDKHGLRGVTPGKAINFWSGKEGAMKASADQAALSDSDIPAFCFLFKCWGKAKEHPEGKELVGSLMPRLFSYIFSKYAKGEVNVYMASKAPKAGVDETVLLADSAFWSTELANLFKNDKVSKVLLHIHVEGTKDQFKAPIDLKDPASKVFVDKILMSVRDGDFVSSIGTQRKLLQKWKAKATGVKSLSDYVSLMRDAAKDLESSTQA